MPIDEIIINMFFCVLNGQVLLVEVCNNVLV